jgi:hypothetical protein
MKKLLLTLSLLGCTLASTLAQGTIAFGNSVASRISIQIPGYPARTATAADGLSISIWYGPAGSTRDQLVMAPGVASIGPTAGVMVNAASVFALPGTSPNEVVSLQLRAEGNGLCGETAIGQVTLGQTAGPGAVIWHPRGGVSFAGFILYPCPEPSVLALGALASFGLLLRLRKSPKGN